MSDLQRGAIERDEFIGVAQIEVPAYLYEFPHILFKRSQLPLWSKLDRGTTAVNSHGCRD